ncbi:MAG TPA: hypothetical protein VD701_05255 [Steroidobacteraceae bacterium]|nr:hypothetical protein [Steroidobacteraceae bacterium]
MGVSETIIAASIGAAATVMTALFQLFGAIRNSKSSAPPKRGSTLRSIVAVLALMVASGVGGYMLSELRQERTARDLRSIRDELSAQLQTVEANTARLAAREAAPAATSDAVVSTHQLIEREAAIYVPACGSGACSEVQAQSMALCDAIPAALQVTHLDLFVRAAGAQHDWELSRVNFEQDADGGKFVGGIQEQADANDRKNVCVTFVHWGAKPLVARMVLHAAALPQMPAPESTGAQPASRFGAEAIATQFAGSRGPGAATPGPASP